MMVKMAVALLTTCFLMLGLAGTTEAATDLPVLTPGWNLVGLMRGAEASPLDVTELGEVKSVWKWTQINGVKTWAVYLPGEGVPGGFAASKGFAYLDTINPGDGFWVNVPDPAGVTTTTTTTVSSSTTSTTLPSAVVALIPPVATTMVGVIVNVDSRKMNEVNEDRLFANWDGTNAAASDPAGPIDPTKYEFTTSLQIYDSTGASHDLTVYFDRTTTDNQWEYLVTCDPADDRRALTPTEKIIYNPDSKYNYENHKGAGALMYGTMQFDTSGNIAQIDAFKVPPDGQVDPAKTDNRMLLEAGTSYFSFPSNFNGADTNQQIEINFGAIYEGKTSTQRQVLVSDLGARALGTGGDVSSFATSATTWSQVADANGNTITQGDMFIFEGFNNGSDPVTRLVYTVQPGNDIQDLLTQLEGTFSCSAAIDEQGRLRITDDTSGASSMYVTRFETISATAAIPFGGEHGKAPNAYAMTPGGITSDGTIVVTTAATSLIGLQGKALPKILTGDTFSFAGTDVDGKAVAANFMVGTTGTTITHLLTFLDATFGGVNGGVHSVLDQEGRIRVVDTSHSGALLVNAGFATALASSPLSANPFALADGAVALSLPSGQGLLGQINITTSKKMVLSTGRALSSNSGDTTPIQATTLLSSVHDDNADPAINSGLPRGVKDGDTYTFTGTKHDGANVTSIVTVVFTKSDGNPGTMQDILDQLSTDFECTASLDKAGRLVLTDTKADTISSPSSLSMATITYGYPNNVGSGPWPDTTPDIFGTSAFDFIPADISVEDGSVEGDTATTNFSPYAVASTQYANSSTTIVQDQNGFASGSLQSLSTDVNGIILGHYSNGSVVPLGQCGCNDCY